MEFFVEDHLLIWILQGKEESADPHLGAGSWQSVCDERKGVSAKQHFV